MPLKSCVDEHCTLAQSGLLFVAGAYLILPEIASPEMLPEISAFSSYMQLPWLCMTVPNAVMSKSFPVAVPWNLLVPMTARSPRAGKPWSVPLRFLSCCSTRNGMSLTDFPGTQSVEPIWQPSSP